MKLSPCCKARVEKKKRYGGLIVNDYCKKCKRRLWPGGRTVRRNELTKLESQALRKLAKKYQKRKPHTEKFLDTLAAVLNERRDYDA